MFSFYLLGWYFLFPAYFVNDVSNFFFLLWPNLLRPKSFLGAYVRHTAYCVYYHSLNLYVIRIEDSYVLE
jgi:hypothetical protein